MQEALVRFLDALEAVAAAHEEVFDTDVREAMAWAIEERLVKQTRTADVGDNFAMLSPEGNRLIRDAVMTYLAAALPVADALGLDEAARLKAVWDPAGFSSTGRRVDQFLGCPSPDWPADLPA